jgi:hypothetical protein
MSKLTIEQEAEIKVQEIMYAIVSLLNQYGITDIRAGAIMRLLGTPEEEALLFDNKKLVIDGEFLDLRDVDEIPGEHDPDKDIGADTTLH